MSLWPPKSETRSPKPETSTNRRKPELAKRHCARWFWALATGELGLVSDFGFRISDLTFMARWYTVQMSPWHRESLRCPGALALQTIGWTYGSNLLNAQPQTHPQAQEESRLCQ